MRDSTARRLSRLHSVLFRLTRGRVGRRLVNNDMLLLTTRGRKSGRIHTVPLLYLEDERVWVVIASWGGRDHHPDWYRNLVSCPIATVNVGGTSYEVTGRTANPEERAMWWLRAEAAYPGYAEYRSRTEREIPIVFLSR